jgi:hypothetical protein
LSLSLDVIAQLACEAEFRDMRIADLIGELIEGMVKKDLFSVVLGKPLKHRLSASESLAKLRRHHGRNAQIIAAE